MDENHYLEMFLVIERFKGVSQTIRGSDIKTSTCFLYIQIKVSFLQISAGASPLLQTKDTAVGFIADSKLTGGIRHCTTVSLIFLGVVL